MRSSKYGLGLAITAACMAFGVSAASAATFEVIPTDVDSGGEWIKPAGSNLGVGTALFETGPKLSPLGTGSLEFTTTNSPDKAQVLTTRYLGTELSSITELGHSTFRDPSATDPAEIVLPSIQLPTDVDGDFATAGFTTLVYEPYQAWGNADIETNEWQDWDATQPGTVDGGWWATGTVGTTIGCPQANTCTFAEIKAALPAAKVYGVALNQGTANTGGLANADALYVKLAGQDQTTFDFESEAGPTGPTGPAGGTGNTGATGPQGQQGTSGTVTPSAISTGKVALTSKSLKASKRRKVSVSISCPRANGLCEGRLALVKGRKVLARQSFVVRGGRSGKVTFSLSRSAYKALKKSQRVKVDAFARDLAGAASQSAKTLTLKK